MSIIEKALNKSGVPADGQPVQAPAAAEEPSAGLIERAVTRNSASASAASASEPVLRNEPSRGSAAIDDQISRQISFDLAKLRARGLLTADDERTQLAEEYRLIKRPLLANAFGANPIPKGNMVMVTSSLPGEGKSFTAINLAISIAMELDRTVLLVDADVAKPRLPEYLGFRAEHGLLDILQQSSHDLSKAILRTSIQNLAILPAGKTYARATELLASEAMYRLIDDLANRYPDRLVLFDSPPLLSTSESSVLASHMGQIAMVVEVDKTPKSAVKEALSRIEGACDVVGVILNKSTGRRADGYYGYYGYGGYAKQA